MKYPPVVSTLQEWLDGKLGTQGIDAVSCAFYVLSLLQGDQTDEPEAFYHFPYSKVVDDQGIPYWPQDSWSVWGFDCSENSLAAKNIPAPVQGYEIELLGNELSPHLKSIRSESCVSNIAQQCRCDKQGFSLSAGDTGKCCEALSVGGPPNDRGKCVVGSVTERNSTLHANESACVGFFKHKLEGGGLAKKSSSPFMAEAMIKHDKIEDQYMADATDPGIRKPLFVHDEKLLWEKNDDDGPGLPWNVGDEQSSSTPAATLKQGKRGPGLQDLWETDTFCKQFKGSGSASMPYMGSDNKLGADDLTEKNEDDHSLAQLIAKFDHSIAAIWNLNNPRPASYDVIDGQQELPWSFHNLISPQDDTIKMELNSFDNSEPYPEESSFIHCGTNITNSIWSEQSYLGNPVNQDDSSLKYINEGESLLDSCVNEDRSDLCCKLKVLLATDDLLQNEFNFLEWNSGTSNTSINNRNTDVNVLQKVPEEDPNALWNKIQTFPSFFSDISFQEQFCRVESFQDAGCANPQDENLCMVSCSPCAAPPFGNSALKNIRNVAEYGNRNFNTLNHNREDSSFTEVIPRHAGGRKLVHDTKVNCSYFNQIKHSLGVANQSLEECKNGHENSGKKDEEEDLLTSTRTHFRPIHQECMDPHNNPGNCYADGTTFIISSSFVDVPFKRSESGTLFLDNEDVTVAPKKYMEYKERKIDHMRGGCYSFSKEVEGSKGAFIPKFCVRQIEKCCQTEESDEISEEINSKRNNRHDKEKEDKDNLFFSDEEIVKRVADYLDDDNGKFTTDDTDCKDNQHDLGMDDTLSQNMRNDAISKSLEAENYIWNKSGCRCNYNYLFSSKNDSLGMFGAGVLSEKEGLWSSDSTRMCQSQYSIWSCSPGPLLETCPACESLPLACPLRDELREELSEDGEQLLSDLSSLQHLQLGTGWLDDTLEQRGWGGGGGGGSGEHALRTRVSCSAAVGSSLRAK